MLSKSIDTFVVGASEKWVYMSNVSSKVTLGSTHHHLEEPQEKALGTGSWHTDGGHRAAPLPGRPLLPFRTCFFIKCSLPFLRDTGQALG